MMQNYLILLNKIFKCKFRASNLLDDTGHKVSYTRIKVVQKSLKFKKCKTWGQ